MRFVLGLLLGAMLPSVGYSQIKIDPPKMQIPQIQIGEEARKKAEEDLRKAQSQVGEELKKAELARIKAEEHLAKVEASSKVSLDSKQSSTTPASGTMSPGSLQVQVSDRELTRDSFYLAIYILIFGILVMIVVFALSYLGKINNDMTFKLIALSLIITVGAFLIPAGL